jgi:hypothetical protein
MSDQLVAEAITFKIHNKQKDETSTCSAVFETAILAMEQSPTYALDRMVTGIGLRFIYCEKIFLVSKLTTLYINMSLQEFKKNRFISLNIHRAVKKKKPQIGSLL